jgi:hypothetical protein
MNDNIIKDKTKAGSMNDNIIKDKTKAGSMNDNIIKDKTKAGLFDLKRGSIHMKCSMTGQEKCDPLIQVTA